MGRVISLTAAAAALATAAMLQPSAAAEPAADYPTDERGYTGSAARCDDDQTANSGVR